MILVLFPVIYRHCWCVLAGEHDGILQSSVISVRIIFKLGSVFHWSANFRFYGLSIRSHDHLFMTMRPDDRLEGSETYPFTRICCSQHEKPTEYYQTEGVHINHYSMSCLDTADSFSCAYYASHLQQKLSFTTVGSHIFQTIAVRLVRTHGRL